MLTLTLQMPEEVAAEYYQAADELNRQLGDPTPKLDAKALMIFALSRFEARDVSQQFDLALRVVTGRDDPPLNPAWK